jgi:hypothetical protein
MKKEIIPSESEFAIAKQKMRARLAREAEIRDRILSCIPQGLPCHDVWAWFNEPNTTISYVYPNNSDLEDHELNGTKERVEGIVREAATPSENNKLVIEYHSHENVLKRFNGNYDKYFR